ncbi:MAG: hypothetical protein LBL45_04935 [Treponema sp.]|jgi:hypothetical protein|nr:hypothetical protein [Treponema sp.]
MRLLARSGDIFIYDNGDNWYNVNNYKKPAVEMFVPKSQNSFYPPATCLKWGFEPVDVEYLNKLSNGGLEAVADYGND